MRGKRKIEIIFLHQILGEDFSIFHAELTDLSLRFEHICQFQKRQAISFICPIEPEKLSTEQTTTEQAHQRTREDNL